MAPRTPLVIVLAASVAVGWFLSGLLGLLPPLRSSAAVHRISADDLGLALPPLNFSSPPSTDAHRAYYGSSAAAAFCAAHGYAVFEPRSTSGERKIYDLFMVNSELDFLEIRLATLYEHVDYFVIVESPRTFQGRVRNLVIRDNWQRFARWHDKIIYHLLEFPAHFAPVRTWDYEDLQRDATFAQVLPRLEGRQAPVTGDVLVVADVDEIPRPETLLLLRTCAFPRRLTLASRFYYYSFQFLHVGAEWPHPQATFYEGPDSTLRPRDLRGANGDGRWRRARESGTLGNAAWHCSSCFATVDQFLDKMASFSHMWMNEPRYRDRRRIADAVRAGRDVWGRTKDHFRRVDGNSDLPPVLATDEGRRRFGYMLSRDGESAGFTDFP
ncbi:glycosyltransferase family 17 [Drechmeria coniospora]|uniref:Glycosyltransferase family 17 n=1 Tax=Drechmeria coniospora TaxID=98403 RepID=A0A151GM53_DRECN|nr:glycosyltransferase family 17 [Drechmeria coniospora]KYK58072.1 glycosyltransferase family 17 [Drechmeria coniospora]ODA83092.1 hypothetical protein RJ55_01601 [Drechmeria coniospora]